MDTGSVAGQTRASVGEKEKPWQPAKARNAHTRFVRVRLLRGSTAARSAKRWKIHRTWTARALTRSARAERKPRPTHSHQCTALRTARKNRGASLECPCVQLARR